MTGITPVRWDTDRLILVDQTLLPEREVERGYQSWQDVGAAIRAVRPYAVDVSSGIESAPGIKDAHEMQQFVAAVRSAFGE